LSGNAKIARTKAVRPQGGNAEELSVFQRHTGGMKALIPRGYRAPFDTITQITPSDPTSGRGRRPALIARKEGDGIVIPRTGHHNPSDEEPLKKRRVERGEERRARREHFDLMAGCARSFIMVRAIRRSVCHCAASVMAITIGLKVRRRVVVVSVSEAGHRPIAGGHICPHTGNQFAGRALVIAVLLVPERSNGCRGDQERAHDNGEAVYAAEEPPGISRKLSQHE